MHEKPKTLPSDAETSTGDLADAPTENNLEEETRRAMAQLMLDSQTEETRGGNVSLISGSRLRPDVSIPIC